MLIVLRLRNLALENQNLAYWRRWVPFIFDFSHRLIPYPVSDFPSCCHRADHAPQN